MPLPFEKPDGFFGCTGEFITEFYIAFDDASVVMNKTSFRLINKVI